MMSGQLPPRKIVPPDNFPRGKLPPENRLLTIKFPLKIIAPTQANSAKEYYG